MKPFLALALLSTALTPAYAQTFQQGSSTPTPDRPLGVAGSMAGATGPTATMAPSTRSQAIRYDTRNGYSLAFVEADVRRVVDAVLGSMLGLDYSVDPKVEGNITLRTAKPVAQESLLPLLENALATVDAAIVIRGSSYRVVARSDARTNAPIVATGVSGGGSGYATEVVELKNASAREIARLLEQFLGKEAVAGTDAARNQVIITGTGDERQAARAMIARFDVDALAGMNFSLLKLENVDADTLLAELESIFKPPLDIIGSRVRVVPLPRLRSILLIAADRADFGRIEPWIRRLDAGSGGKAKLYSYAVQNGRAKDLAASLQLVLGMGGNQNEPASPSRTNSIASSDGNGGATQLEPSQAIASQTPLPGSSTATASFGGSSNGPRIVPNDENNSLLIYATGEQYEFIREALEKLDRPGAQVLIEATLAEVTLSNDFSLGVDWSIVSGKSTFDLRNNGAGAPAALFPGFSYGYVGSTAKAVLNTLQSKTNVRVLSAPKLIVLNNQTATLQVGDQVPIVTQQAQSVSAPGAPVVNSIELRDTGVILKVTPRVNDSGTIILDIAQEVSDVAETTTSGINSPTIQQRRLATTVATRSGQMIALGGLIRDRTTRLKSGIPLLSQIPIIGAAFGSQENRGSRTELIILLTPTVMRSADETKAIVDELTEGLDLTRPLVDRAKSKQVGAPRPPR